MTEIIVEKACTKCKIVKSLVSFSKCARVKDGRKAQCRKCSNEIYKYLSTEEYMRWTSMWQKYGLTVEQYDALVEKQQGLCAICNEAPKENRRLHVDHCHETGRVRGLLCKGCNNGLGHFKDSVKCLQIAITYLESVEGESKPTHGRFHHMKPPYGRHKRGDAHHSRNGGQLVGVNHGMALFTEDQIREFRRRYDNGESTSVGMAREEGCSKPAMQAITSRRHWKHVD